MMKIGIITYHRSINYGAFLQAYGLCSKLNEYEGITAELIDFNMDRERKYYSLSLKRLLRYRSIPKIQFYRRLRRTFQEALKYQKRSWDYWHSDDIEAFYARIRGAYDIVVCGSDEIWKLDGMRGFPSPYWLSGEIGALKFSYAASSRSILRNCDHEVVSKVREILSGFSLISVRDDITLQELAACVRPGCKILLSPDPSLVYHYEIKDEMISPNVKEITKQKYILIMTPEEKVVQKIKEHFQGEYQLISVFDFNRGCVNLSDINPFEWIELVKNAAFIFSSYFHCICFSIKYQKQFLAIGSLSKKDKLADLLGKAGLSDRFVSAQELADGRVDLMEAYQKCSTIMDTSAFLHSCESSFDEYVREMKEIYASVRGEEDDDEN